ncbi:MAG: glutathione S-transferase family protein [Pseudomonadota bacterium]
MGKLLDKDILTREVLDWQGVHLLHFMGSSCSQKSRIYLNLKNIDWESHHVDLAQRENNSDWFMGINPRGLVPVLVHDGQVIIESNDILEYIEAQFPAPALVPAALRDEVHEMLAFEDELHLDLRTISMRFLFDAKRAMRSDEDLETYKNSGSGTVDGVPDPHKLVEIAFHEAVRENQGVPDDMVRESAQKFYAAFAQMDERLDGHSYLLGDEISLVDIAWYIYAARLIACTYPLHELHPRLGAWYDQLNTRAEFAREVQLPPPLVAWRDKQHAEDQANGTTLTEIGNLRS